MIETIESDGSIILSVLEGTICVKHERQCIKVTFIDGSNEIIIPLMGKDKDQLIKALVNGPVYEI
jgi:hypothetical protein